MVTNIKVKQKALLITEDSSHPLQSKCHVYHQGDVLDALPSEF